MNTPLEAFSKMATPEGLVKRGGGGGGGGGGEYPLGSIFQNGHPRGFGEYTPPPPKKKT